MILHEYGKLISIHSENAGIAPEEVSGKEFGVAVCPLKCGRINKTITPTITALRCTQDSFLWKFDATN